LGGQEVSKPVLITVIALVVIILGVVGWNYFLRPQTYPGFQAPSGRARAGGPGAQQMIPGMEPGRTSPQPGGPR